MAPHVSHSFPMLCDFVEEVNVFKWAFVVIRALTIVIMVMCLRQESDLSFIKKKKKFICVWLGGERERERVL